MPYVQSERAILYSLHRGASSRGLQAGRERELVPGLCVEWCGLLEMLISCSEGACVLQSVARCLRVCASVVLDLFSLYLEAAPVTPFYSRRKARGWYMDCYVAFCERRRRAEPCSLSLWRHGRWSGIVLGALERRAGHAWSCETWELLRWQARLPLPEACWLLHV